jgi:hypothetical protein
MGQQGRECTLEELRARAERLATWFREERERNPQAEEALRRGVVLSRHLARLLSRPDLKAEYARHHVKRTLRYLNCWKGIPYYELQQLASDVVLWSDKRDAA